MSDINEIQLVASSFLKKLFYSEATSSPLLTEGSCISESQVQFLNTQVSISEIETTMDQLPPSKALGPDGMHGIFLKKFWVVLKVEMIAFIEAFFCGEKSLGLNHIFCPNTKS